MNVILLICPRNNNVTKITNIEPTIDFTYELENNNIPFLDILLISKEKKEFKVHHKTTDQDD